MSDTHIPAARILAVVASPRAGGNSDVLAEQIAGGAAEVSVDTEIVHLRDLEYSSCIGCELCREGNRCLRFKDDMQDLYEKVMDSQGLVLVSPVYNYNVTAWMKSFLDRLYCFYEFDYPRPGPWSSKLAGQDRKLLAVAVGEQHDKADAGFTLEAMQRPMDALGYELAESLLTMSTFERGEVSDKPEELAAAKEAGRTLALSILPTDDRESS